jgi:hypothetical protein
MQYREKEANVDSKGERAEGVGERERERIGGAINILAFGGGSLFFPLVICFFPFGLFLLFYLFSFCSLSV